MSLSNDQLVELGEAVSSAMRNPILLDASFINDEDAEIYDAEGDLETNTIVVINWEGKRVVEIWRMYDPDWLGSD